MYARDGLGVQSELGTTRAAPRRLRRGFVATSPAIVEPSARSDFPFELPLPTLAEDGGWRAGPNSRVRSVRQSQPPCLGVNRGEIHDDRQWRVS